MHSGAPCSAPLSRRPAEQDFSCSPLSPMVNLIPAPMPELQSAPAGTKTNQSAAFRWLQHTSGLEGRLQPLLAPRWQTLRSPGWRFDLGRRQNQASWGCALSGWLWPGQPAAGGRQNPCPSPASWRSTCCPQRPQLRLSAGRRVGKAELTAETLDETCTTVSHMLTIAPTAAAICRQANASQEPKQRHEACMTVLYPLPMALATAATC